MAVGRDTSVTVIAHQLLDEAHNGSVCRCDLTCERLGKERKAVISDDK